MRNIGRIIVAFVCIFCTLNMLGSTANLIQQDTTYFTRIANQTYQPSPDQLTSMANRITALANSARADGTLQALESVLLQNRTIKPNATMLYNAMRAKGWQGTPTQVKEWIVPVSKILQNSLMDKIAKGGLYSMLTVDLAGAFRNAANEIISSNQVHFLQANYSYARFMRVGLSAGRCAVLDQTIAQLAVIAAIAACNPATAPLALTLGICIAGLALERSFMCAN